jgi:hypothetical protein
MPVSEVVSTGHSWGLGQLLVRLSAAPDANWIRRFDDACPVYGTEPGILALVKANDPCLSGDRVTWSGVPKELVPQHSAISLTTSVPLSERRVIKRLPSATFETPVPAASRTSPWRVNPHPRRVDAVQCPVRHG